MGNERKENKKLREDTGAKFPLFFVPCHSIIDLVNKMKPVEVR